MKITYIINKLKEIQDCLDAIDYFNVSSEQRRYNQKRLNEAYKLIDNFHDELIREKIKRRNEKC